MGAVVGSRDLDLNLAKGELVAIISEADTRGDRRRWLVDAGGRKQYLIMKMDKIEIIVLHSEQQMC